MNDKIMLDAHDVSKLLNIKLYLAYKIIRQCNANLKASGKLTIRGRVNKAYLYKQLDVSDM